MATKTSIVSSGLGTTKAINIDVFFDYLEDLGRGSGDARDNYSKVSWVFRATTMRANAISRIPYRVVDEDGKEVAWPFPMSSLFRTLEADLCLGGAGFVLKDESVRAIKGLQRLNPWSMKVDTDPKKGITGFIQKPSSGDPTEYKPKQIIYFDHMYNPYDDLGPGIAPGEVSGLSGALIQNMNQFASNYFENGAIPAVVLETEHKVTKEQQQEMRKIWNKLLQGVKNAWNTVILQKDVKAKVIGSNTGDLAMPELEESAKKQIAIAFGIPMGVLEQQDVSHSTAQAHHVTFWTDTIIPEARLLAEKLNSDLMAEVGKRFEFKFEDIEAIQAVEFQKAQSLSALLQQANQAVMNTILSPNEARMVYQVGFDRMGFSQLAMELLDKEPVQPPGQLEDMSKPPPDKGNGRKKALGAAPQKVFRELAKWRKTAPDNGKDFDTDILPQWMQDQIKAVIDWAGSEDAFLFLKQVQARVELERRLRAKIEPLLAEYRARVERLLRKAGVEGFSVEDALRYQLLVEEFEAAVKPEVRAVVADRLMTVSSEVGVQFDPSFVNVEAAELVQGYARDLAKDLTETTMEGVRKAVATTISTEGMGLDDAISMLEPVFGESRAEMIAVTETTRAYSMATNKYNRELQGQGIDVRRVWQTAADDRVCPVCGPLNGQPEKHWQGRFPEGPPAHPRCRCVVNVSSLSDEYHEERAEQLAQEREQFLAELEAEREA